jgi:hypothetical protein
MVPCCAFHNRTKERGYTVWRDTNTGEIHIVTPGGEQISSRNRSIHQLRSRDLALILSSAHMRRPTSA